MKCLRCIRLLDEYPPAPLPQPRQTILLSENSSEPTGHLPQQLPTLPSLLADSPRRQVQLHQHDGQRMAMALCPLESMLQPIMEQGRRAKAGQGIPAGRSPRNQAAGHKSQQPNPLGFEIHDGKQQLPTLCLRIEQVDLMPAPRLSLDTGSGQGLANRQQLVDVDRISQLLVGQPHQLAKDTISRQQPAAGTDGGKPYSGVLEGKRGERHWVVPHSWPCGSASWRRPALVDGHALCSYPLLARKTCRRHPFSLYRLGSANLD